MTFYKPTNKNKTWQWDDLIDDPIGTAAHDPLGLQQMMGTQGTFFDPAEHAEFTKKLFGIPLAEGGSVADAVAERGRYGDTELLHINRAELELLDSLAPGSITINPETGAYEAWAWIPAIIGALMGAGGAAAGGADTETALLSGVLGAFTGGMGGAAVGAGGAAAGAEGAATGAAEVAAQQAAEEAARQAAEEAARRAAEEAATSAITGETASTALPAAVENAIAGTGASNIPFGDVLNVSGDLAREVQGMNQTGLGGLSSITNWIGEHPMMAAGLLAVPSLFPNEPEYEEEQYEDIPENFPTGPGPRAGYDWSQPVMGESIPAEYWSRYGRASAAELPGGYSGEWQFFPDNELRAPPSPSGSSDPTRYSGGLGSAVWGDGLSEEEMIRRLRHRQAYAGGGLVTGPGGPTDDMVQAAGPGNMPIRLSAGEYVMPAKAVQNAGGPEAMNKLRKRLLTAGSRR